MATATVLTPDSIGVWVGNANCVEHTCEVVNAVLDTAGKLQLHRRSSSLTELFSVGDYDVTEAAQSAQYNAPYFVKLQSKTGRSKYNRR